MLLINQVKLNIYDSTELIPNKIASYLGILKDEINDVSIVKRSIDARKKPDIFYIYSCIFSAKNEDKLLKTAQKKKLTNLSKWEEKSFVQEKVSFINESDRPIIIGFGPAGIFAALYLSRANMRPVVYEMGSSSDTRAEEVNKFWLSGKLNSSSNVQFGEGGAGTFSDGKLNTLIKDKDGCMHYVLQTFVEFGANPAILYDAKPHVGTDKLIDIIKNIREEIIKLGGEIHFNSKVTDFLIEETNIIGCVVNGEKKYSKNIILACGHSSRETFERCNELNIPMQSKPFAVGFRVQHPQALIDKALYGKSIKELGPAPYKVTAKTSSQRGAYSFCMCPGGYVVNASSEDKRLCINGMSYSDRSSGVANSAILVNIPADYYGSEVLSGMQFQREIEEKAFNLCNGKIPVQRLGSFLDSIENTNKYTESDDSFEPKFKGQYEYADITSILPAELNKDIAEGFKVFGKSINGFDSKDALLAAVESRSSSPVKFVRDDLFESSIKGLYPIGEGAGYAGGIVSAAVDGARCGKIVVDKVNNKINNK